MYIQTCTVPIIYMYIHTYIPMFTCKYSYIYMYMHTYVHIHVVTYRHVHTYTCTRTHISYMYIHTCTHTYIIIYIYIYNYNSDESQVLPIAIPVLLSIPLTSPYAVRATTLRLVGELSRWISKHPDTLSESIYLSIYVFVYIYNIYMYV